MNPEDFMAAYGGLGADMAGGFGGLDASALDLGGFNDVAGLGGDMGAMTPDLYGSLGAGLDTGLLDATGGMGAVNPATQGIAGLEGTISPEMAGGNADLWGGLSKGVGGLAGLMGMYNSWQKMNILKSNEQRNQQGFDLANQRYDARQSHLANVFA